MSNHLNKLYKYLFSVGNFLRSSKYLMQTPNYSLKKAKEIFMTGITVF